MKQAGKSFFFLSFIALAFFAIGCNSCQSGDNDQLETTPDTIAVEPQEEIKKELTGEDIRLEKDIRYDKYLLDDEYPYKDTTRHFQWEKDTIPLSV